MPFTEGGLEWVAQQLRERLAGARIVVGDGETPVNSNDEELAGAATAEKVVEEIEIVGRVEDGDRAVHRVILRTTFGENEANFDWRERGVLTSEGVLIDRAVADQGRKVQGSVWTLEAVVDLVP